jgi:lipocalin
MIRQLCNTLVFLFLAAGCSSSLAPLKTVEKVDLPRFMGDWHVIATIPSFIEKGATTGLSPIGSIKTALSPQHLPFGKAGSTAR